MFSLLYTWRIPYHSDAQIQIPVGQILKVISCGRYDDADDSQVTHGHMHDCIAIKKAGFGQRNPAKTGFYFPVFGIIC